MLLEIGRVCIKTVGHEANQKCVILDTIDNNFVIVAGPRVKKRRCNIQHLEILPNTINIKKGASESEIIDALLKSGVITQEDLPKKPAGYEPKPRSVAKKPIEKPVEKKKKQKK